MSTNEKDLKHEAPAHLEHAAGSLYEEDFKIESTRPNGKVDSEVAAFQSSDIVIDEAENKRLRGLVTKRVLVVMLVTYFFQGLDKGTIGFASIMGIREDTHLVGQQYSWLTTIFYLAAVLLEWPMNFIVQKFPVARVLSICVFFWGASLATTAACTNFTSLMIVRFFLGAFESAVQPCFLIMTSMWYKRSEQGEIVSYWYGMNGIQAMFGGLFAYGLLHYEGAIKSWQLLFTILGCLTVAWSVFMFWWLPDSPMRAKCWDEETKTKLVERVRENQTGLQNKEYKLSHVKEALTDPALLMLFLTQVANCLCSGGNSAFSNIVIKSFGFTTLQTQLLNIAQGAVVIFTCVVPAWLARKYQQTIWIMVAASFPMIAGTLVIMQIPPTPTNRVGLLIAYYTIFTLNAVAVLLYGLLIRNIAGRTKQATAIVVVFLGWAAGNCIGPQVFRAADAPRYKTGFAVYLACACLQIVVLTSLRFLYVFRNKTKKALRASLRDGDDTVRTDHAFDDLTDKENIDFVYHL